MRKQLYRRIFLWVLLILSLVLLIKLIPTLTSSNTIRADDFVRFWAGAKLTLGGENPFDPTNINRLQAEAGMAISGEEITSIILNPPWAISFFLPFGLLSYPLSRLIWLLVSIILVVICSSLLWYYYKGLPNQKWIAWVAVIIFAPTISVLEKGQIAPIVLLSIVGFIYFVEYRHNDLAAGAFLALATIKPQIAYIFGLAVLIWVIQQRRWLVFVGAGVTTILLTLLPMILNPSIIPQYLSAMQTYQTAEWATPTFGSYLRFFLFGTNAIWPQFLPVVFGVLWFMFYWHRHARCWNWVERLPALLLVSLLTAPYAWTYDYVILLPAVIQAAVWLIKERKSWSTYVLVGVFVGISILDLALHIKQSDFWFIWLAPAILIWYLLVRINNLRLKPAAIL